ncbi:uncharacterized protein LOC118196316, partial [Stegodyphus dumicola]|uniref:uncharacterized protein LOC118196316 n=1 Tax=Stegodyphus dumicola TaxID=202533 RepID=UPI0015A83CE7
MGGSFYVSRHDTGIGRHHRIPEVKERILNTVGDNPSSSSRAVERALGVSLATVLRTLHEDGIHLYHLQSVDLGRTFLPLQDTFTSYQRPSKSLKECEDSFKQLKEALTFALVLMYPHLDKPFILDMDASNDTLFLNAAMDSNVVVRKQMIQSLTAVLGNYYDNSLVQMYWIKCIFPLVKDPETGVQVKALMAMEEQFLQNIFSNDHTERNIAFSLLNHLSNGQLLSYKRYLQKAFNSWKSENRLRYQVVGQLEKHFGKDKDKCIWFYLSIFAAYSKLPPKICSHIEDTEKYTNTENFPDFMDLVLKVLGYALNSLPEGKLRVIGDIFKRNLLQFVVPVELIPITIEVLHKIEKHLENQEEFSKFSSEITEVSVDCLSQFVFERHLKNTPSEELIVKHLSVVKEFCQISPSYISDEFILILKTFISSNTN